MRVGAPIVSMWSGQQLWVQAWVDEANLGRLKIGKIVDVSLRAFPDQTFIGRVEAIGVVSSGDPSLDVPRPQHESKDSRVSVRIAVPDTNKRLMPGLSAIVGIPKADRRQPSLVAENEPRVR